MNGAQGSITTVAPGVHRRNMLAGGAAAALVGAAIACQAKGAEVGQVFPPSDADAELIALSTDYATAHSEICRLEAAYNVTDETFVPLDTIRHRAQRRAAELPALTAAGMRAKAAIYLGEVELLGEDDGPLDGLATSLARDLLAGRASA